MYSKSFLILFLLFPIFGYSETMIINIETKYDDGYAMLGIYDRKNNVIRLGRLPSFGTPFKKRMNHIFRQVHPLFSTFFVYDPIKITSQNVK